MVTLSAITSLKYNRSLTKKHGNFFSKDSSDLNDLISQDQDDYIHVTRQESLSSSRKKLSFLKKLWEFLK